MVGVYVLVNSIKKVISFTWKEDPILNIFVSAKPNHFL